MFSLSTPSLTAASVQYRRVHKEFRCTAYVAPSPAFSVPTLEKVIKMTSTKNGVAPEMSTRGKMVRFGGLDELVYKERFVVRSSQVGVNKTATIETIASLLQDTSCNRFQRLGWSTDGFPSPPTMRKHHLIWITSRAHIQMYKYPAWGDVVEIEHWCEPDGKIAARFDSIIRNSSTGEVIGRATRLAFSEENNGSLKKIPKLEEPADYSQLGLAPRRADLDMNKHVNNVTYLSWLLQSIPQDIVDTHELVATTLEYRHECQYSDSIDSLASIEVEVELDSDANTEDHRQFLHLLKFSGTNHEINRGRTVWRKLER